MYSIQPQPSVLRQGLKIFFSFLLLLVLLVPVIFSIFTIKAVKRESKTLEQAAPASGYFVQAADLKIFVQEMGPATGRPILLIHGTGAWSEIWRETMVALSGAGFRVVAIDVPPFGFSEKPVGPEMYTRDKQAVRVKGVLDALEIKKATIVAHSVGGRPGVETALLFPERVEKLIVVDPALGFQSNESEAPHFVQNQPGLAMKLVFGSINIRNSIFAATVTNPQLGKIILSSFVSNKSAVTPERVAMLQKSLVVKGATSAYADWFQNLLVNQDNSRGSNFAEFKKLSMPVDIMWGDIDTVTPVWQGKQLQTLIPNAELHIIKNVGHIPYIEASNEFNALLLTVLKK